MQFINYYVVSVSFITAGYATLAAAGKYRVAAVVSVGGIVVSLVFNALDARTRELLHAAEPALHKLQADLVCCGHPEMDLLARSGRGQRRSLSYRTSINLLTVAGVVAFGVGLAHALASS